MGDLNWLPFSVRAGHQAAKFWTRVSRLSDSCLVRKAMAVQHDLTNQRKPCWLSNFKVMLMSLNDHDVNNIWNEWIRDDDASRFLRRLMSIKRLRFNATQAGTVAQEEIVSIDRLVEEALIRGAMNTWKWDIDREEAKRGKGSNKLRTYRRFKDHVYMEPYLLHVVDDRKRALMFKFRSGIAPLRIETG